MKKVIFALGVLFVFACSKTEVPSTPPVVVVQEEAIKFTTNIDTGTYNVADTLPLIVTVSSKLPSAGVLYSLLVNWTDSSKQIFKLDTSLTVSSLSLNIPGLKKSGNYSLSVTVTSKSTTSNSLNKSISLVNNPLGRFMGYKVDQVALALSKQKDFGRSYWRNNTYMADVVTSAFLRHAVVNSVVTTSTVFHGSFQAVTAGDFNNDGYIDFFNAGGTYKASGNATSFLIWDPAKKVFIDTTLFNDKTRNFGGNRHNCVPIYLNDDNFVDIIIFDNGDEGISNSPNEPIRIVLSDGKGGYDLKAIETNENYTTAWGGFSNFLYGNKKEGGDVGDLNGDSIPDLVLFCNSQTYIYWGIKSYPFFTQSNHAQFFADIQNFGSLSNNGFGESAPRCTNNAYNGSIYDVNNDGKNDIILGSTEDLNNNLFPVKERVLLNLGNGRFNNNSVIELPSYFKPVQGNPGNLDFVLDDVNGDGLKDIITINYTGGGQGYGIYWDLFIYFQNSDGTFKIDQSSIKFTLNSNRNIVGNYKRFICYFDINGDGQKDILLTESVNWSSTVIKTAFIRTGNQFIEQDYFQFDPYAKSILSILLGRWK
ncbi:MAG: VCBS repeat-containing protein [Chitinophagia bacterium]|nr:VCBS repeat-containing protein [Chitinophagia bacterium]